MAAFLARNYSLRFLCIRQFQNRITDSVYTVIKNKIEAAGWTDEFDILNTSIVHKTTGSEFLFYGMARNIAEIKGTEDIDICWIEEGEGLTEQQWAIIDPTIRKSGAEVWILYNPDVITDFIEAKLPSLLGDDVIIRHINYPENPFLSDTARKKAERLKVTDPDAYRHIYLGEPLTDDDMALIKMSWIDAAINAHEKLGFDPSGQRISALDVADTGSDANAQAFVDGILLTDLDQWKGTKTGDIFATTERAITNCVENGISSFRFDADGLGAGCRGDARVINEHRKADGLQEIDAEPFHGSGEVVDKDKMFIDPVGDMRGITNGQYFSNYKAQSWLALAERFRKTFEAVVKGVDHPADDLISISPDCNFLDKLKTELVQVRRKQGSRKLTIDKAPDDNASPNCADAIMMAYAPKKRRRRGFLSK